ncbi:hypothetical protein GEMRC1_000987 [Eukaryota sp. GEM-RC1]
MELPNLDSPVSVHSFTSSSSGSPIVSLPPFIEERLHSCRCHSGHSLVPQCYSNSSLLPCSGSHASSRSFPSMVKQISHNEFTAIVNLKDNVSLELDLSVDEPTIIKL